jgi:Copper type II ascorbate-dependent monooxygenase, C-terminal domain
MSSRQSLERSARSHPVRARLATVATVSVIVSGIVVARQPQPLAARSAEPTFAEDVAPILYANCTTCHHPGGLGPFSLLDYEGAKAKTDEMHDAVEARYMPPWHAEGPHGVFRNDRRLAEADRQTILRWIESGAKPGDLSKAPPKPEYPAAWSMGTPDAVVTMPVEFTVPASGTVEYQYFEIPTNFTEEKWVQAIEIMPGAREVVHHVLVYAKAPPPPNATPPAPRPAGAPAPAPLFIRNRAHNLPPDPPRLDTLHAPPRQLGALIGSLAPGMTMMEFPKGTALRLRAGTVLTFQMHYTAHGHEMKDRTALAFRFAKEMPDEEIFASQFTNGSFTIPAGAKDVQVPAELGFGQPVRIWGLLPHTHLRGTRWQYTLMKPDSTSEVVLDVPHYDFKWQTYYMFAKPLEIAAGSKLTSMAWYDNSASNKANPDPTKDVKWGDQTWEEMQYTGFLYTVPSRRLRPSGGQH